MTEVSDAPRVMSCRLNNPTATLFGFGDNNAQTSLIMTLASPQVSSDGQVPYPCCTHPPVASVALTLPLSEVMRCQQAFCFVNSSAANPCWGGIRLL